MVTERSGACYVSAVTIDQLGGTCHQWQASQTLTALSTDDRTPTMKPLPAALLGASLAALLSACAGPRFPANAATVDELVARLGPPARRWPMENGGERLAFTTSPLGTQTWMAVTDAGGRVRSVGNVLDMPHFARVQPGMDEDMVMREIGPPYLPWTVSYPARNERVWEWRYCDVWNEPARFDVLFDASTGKVRSTMSLTERQSRDGSGERSEWCSQ